ncbi:MAG: hypothetical protein TUN42_07580 [Dehalogenimonas sp.]
MIDAFPCPVCHTDLEANLATGRKSGKVFVMFKCPVDGRHFRAFVTDRSFVDQVMFLVENKKADGVKG